jgi:lipoate synthase
MNTTTLPEQSTVGHAALGALVRSSYRADRQALAVGVAGAVGAA